MGTQSSSSSRRTWKGRRLRGGRCFIRNRKTRVPFGLKQLRRCSPAYLGEGRLMIARGRGKPVWRARQITELDNEARRRRRERGSQARAEVPAQTDCSSKSDPGHSSITESSALVVPRTMRPQSIRVGDSRRRPSARAEVHCGLSFPRWPLSNRSSLVQSHTSSRQLMPLTSLSGEFSDCL